MSIIIERRDDPSGRVGEPIEFVVTEPSDVEKTALTKAMIDSPNLLLQQDEFGLGEANVEFLYKEDDKNYPTSVEVWVRQRRNEWGIKVIPNPRVTWEQVGYQIDGVSVCIQAILADFE